MKKYQVKIEPESLSDIQEITDQYNRQQTGLGKRFQKAAINQINSLNKDPHIYAIRYKEIRGILVKKFPYMAHFYINGEINTVEVLAVISTDQDPKIWTEKINKRMQVITNSPTSQSGFDIIKTVPLCGQRLCRD